jgi:hypothetical protein
MDSSVERPTRGSEGSELPAPGDGLTCEWGELVVGSIIGFPRGGRGRS